jgi:PAS domain S-box-containing protein
MHKTTWSSAMTKGALFVALSFVLAHVGLPLRNDSIEASPVWLPHGLSLAMILVLGPRFWPAIVIAVGLRTLSGGLPATMAIALGLTKTAEVLFARYLMRGPGRFSGALDSVRSVMALVLGGAVVASIPGALLSVTWLSWSGLAPWSRFTELTIAWWLGDALGVLIVVPVALAFVTERRWSFDRSALTSFAIIGAALFIASELAFGRLVPPAYGLSFAYVSFPFVFWASLRFGVHGAAVSSSLAALHATIGTLRGLGPFARDSPVESLFLLATFMGVMVVTGLLLGAVISERRKVALALRDSQKRYRLASSAGRAGVWDWNLQTDTIYVDPVLKNILGYEDDEIANTMQEWSKLILPEDMRLVQAASKRHLDGDAPVFEVEHRMVHRDGTVRWFLARGELQRDDTGRVCRLTGTDVDITPRKLAEQALERGEHKIRQQLSELENLYHTAPIGLAMTDLHHRYQRINERLAAMNGRSVEDHIGRSIRELMPNVADVTEPIRRRVLDTGESQITEMETSTPGWRGTALVGHYPVYGLDGTVHGIGVIVQDITPQKKAEKRQAGNNRALELVAQGASLEEVMNVLADNVESQSGFGCIIRTITEDSRALRVAAAPSLPRDPDTGLDVVPIGSNGGTCGGAADARRAVATRDVRRDRSWSSLSSAASDAGVRSCWSIPILDSANDVLGTVALHRSEPGLPDAASINIANNAAHLARVAIEHARARDALTKSESSLRDSHDQVQDLAQRLIAAQEEERRRVSRELHDGLNQQLAALSFEIGKIRSQVADAEPELSLRLSELQIRAAHLIDDARRMSHELHPSMLEHLGLVAAVRAYCDEAGRREKLAVRFDPIRPPESIAPHTALCLFRVVQEGVRNAAKHSGASAVQVTLRSSNGSILLAIADNGCGFDVSAGRNGGLGLVSMTERVRAIGGEFGIFSSARQGTRLEVTLPEGS